MNLKQMRDMIVLQAYREDVEIPPTVYPLIDQYINNAYAEFCDDTSYLKAAKSISSASTYTEYKLPSDVKNIINVFYASDKLSEISFMDIDYMVTASDTAIWV